MSNEIILVVDDNHQIADFLAGELLPGLGFKTLVAYNGKTALKIARTCQLDLMLLDLQLPDTTGLEMLHQLASEGRSVPTILASAHGSEQIAVEAFRLGVQDYLIKPLDANSLNVAITHALSGTRLHREKARLTAQLKQQVSWLTVLSKVGQSATSTLELDEVLRRIVEAGVYLTQAEEGFLALLDDQSGQLYLRAVKNTDQDQSKTLRLRVSDSLVGRVVRTGHAVRMAQTDKGQLLKVSTGFLVHSLLHVPILSKGKVLGVLSVDNRISKRAFTEMDEMLLISLADYAAVAIENARLYEQAQQEIAERKRAEAALEKERALLARRVAERTAELSAANAELARAARLKDEFLASMSHELRTPLNTVLGLSETLQEQLYGPLNKRQHKSLRSIEKSGRHLLALINDILDVSKIEAGKLGLEIGPVSVELVCQASLGLTKQIAQKKRLKVSSSFDSAVEIVQADQRRLKQILVNLLSNAVKFTPEGGAISLEVVGDVEREAVHFTVWDTGIGISPEEMERLFQPFVQLDSSLSRQYTGTGLGLALVRRLTELHGGGVSVESEVGKGSRFTVSLPWQGPAGAVEPVGEPELAEAGTPLAVGAAQRPEAERPLILLAEDNEESINTIQDYLLAKGYRVVVARDGAEAIERAREERPELIVMDIQMPGMDGLEATWRLRADAAQSVATVPIIALTALAMPGDRERCLAAGANEYLSKPVSLKGLVKVIEVQLNRNQIGKGDLT